MCNQLFGERVNSKWMWNLRLRVSMWCKEGRYHQGRDTLCSICLLARRCTEYVDILVSYTRGRELTLPQKPSLSPAKYVMRLLQCRHLRQTLDPTHPTSPVPAASPQRQAYQRAILQPAHPQQQSRRLHRQLPVVLFKQLAPPQGSMEAHLPPALLYLLRSLCRVQVYEWRM